MVFSRDISSLHSLVGQKNPKSLKVRGKYKGIELSILIDRGITHNFVQPSIVDKLKIPS